jgi:hypothetical protein
MKYNSIAERSRKKLDHLREICKDVNQTQQQDFLKTNASTQFSKPFIGVNVSNVITNVQAPRNVASTYAPAPNVSFLIFDVSKHVNQAFSVGTPDTTRGFKGLKQEIPTIADIKRMGKRGTLQWIYNSSVEYELQIASAFGKTKPNFQKLTDGQIDQIFKLIKEYVQTQTQ